MMPIVASNNRSVGTRMRVGQKSWKRILKEAIRDPVELCRLMQLPSEYVAAAEKASSLFSVFVPHGYLAKMRVGDPDDPLLRQVLPQFEELCGDVGFTPDPVGDLAAALVPGLLQKYHGRVLMVTTGACAIHCRYCFRRHFPYSDTPRSIDEWQPALDRIASDPSIEEVLLSGGDPLTLVDELLAELAERLSELPHVRRLRIHTRLPIVIPERVTGELLAWLRATRLTPVMVVHANHPDELDSAVGRALAQLVDAGIPVLNQAVLLRGVNDDLATLTELCRRLVDHRVQPYYLHQLDRVSGAAHFEVPLSQGVRLMEGLRAKLPGYAVPQFVQEKEGQSYKVPLA